MNLTKEEEQKIEADANAKYPTTYVFNGMAFDDPQYNRRREAYIAGATSRQLRIKELEDGYDVILRATESMKEDQVINDLRNICKQVLNYKP